MPNPAQTNATLIVNKTTGAIEAPVDAATFKAANDLGGTGVPDAHAASHAAAGSDPVTLAQSQVTNLTTDLGNKQPLATVLTNTTAAFTSAQETKLSGIATGATANSADATLLARANHTGTQSADTLTDGTTNHVFTAADDTKLAGIEAGAQANVALASQAEAEAGTEATKTMTPVRVAQAIAALTTPGGVSSVDGQTGAVVTGYSDRITALENIEPTASGSTLVSGGGVSLTGGLTLTVSAALYNILGVAKSSVETILTADTADATNPRYDVVALDDTGTAVLITGTPAATPVPPTVDPATQLYLTFISIPAGATSITGTEVIIYDENDDYTMSENGTSVVLDSTNNPFAGTKCIEATTMVAGDYFQAQTASGTIDLGTFNVLRFRIRNKAAWHNSKQVTITARLNGVQVGQAVVFKNGLHAFDQANVTTYQHIALNPNLFAAGGQPINQLRWACAGGGTAITGFYVDDIALQAGVSQVTDSTRLRDRGAFSFSLQYDVNDLAYTGSIIYKALQAALGVAQTVTTHWVPFAMLNPMTTTGDVIKGGTSGVPERMATGTGVLTALAVNVGSAGAPVVNGGALGTPSSGALTNCTAVPAGQVVGVIPIANLATGTPDGTKFVKDDGTLATPAGGSGSPGGSDTQVQFNDGGAFGGDAGLVFNKTTDKLTGGAGGIQTGGGFIATGGISGAGISHLQIGYDSSGTQGFINNLDASSLPLPLQITTTKLILSDNNAASFVAMTAGGTATNVALKLSGKGTGAVQIVPTTGTGIALLEVNSSAGLTTYMAYNIGGTPKFYTGAAGGTDELIPGSVAGDGVIRVQAGGTLLIGTNGFDSAVLKITTASGVSTLESIQSNAGVHLKPNGSGYLHFGATAYATGAYSIYNTFAYPFAKTDTTPRNTFFVGSNDASNPFGLNFNVTGNATAASRIFKLQVGAVGVDAAGRLQLDGTSIETIGPLYTAAATTSIPSIRLPHGTAPSSPTDGDMWTTTAGLYVRINGSTVGPLS